MVSRNEPLHPLGGPLRNYILQLRRMLDTVWVATDVPLHQSDIGLFQSDIGFIQGHDD
jgi:hypothetical protein